MTGLVLTMHGMSAHGMKPCTFVCNTFFRGNMGAYANFLHEVYKQRKRGIHQSLAPVRWRFVSDSGRWRKRRYYADHPCRVTVTIDTWYHGWTFCPPAPVAGLAHFLSLLLRAKVWHVGGGGRMPQAHI